MFEVIDQESNPLYHMPRRKNHVSVFSIHAQLFCISCIFVFIRLQFIPQYFLGAFLPSELTLFIFVNYCAMSILGFSPSLSSKHKSGSCWLLWLFSSPPRLYLSLPHSLAPFPLGPIRQNLSLFLDLFLSSAFSPPHTHTRVCQFFRPSLHLSYIISFMV